MTTLGRRTSQLVVIDLQGRLMPAIDRADEVVAQAGRLIAASRLFEVPILFTEQNPRGLGPTVPGLVGPGETVIGKMSFDACRAPGLLESLAPELEIVVAGCEAHVCVLQTVLGLLGAGRRVFVAEDAIGARRPKSNASALARMARHGAEIVTTEMVVFEWLETAEHPRFKDALALVK